MPTDTKLNNLVINYLTQQQYDAIQTPNENELYLTPDNSTGGGGASVPPTLILTDVSGDEPVTKSFLTEEEKTNLEKGLYNQVYYMDTSIGVPNMYVSNYFPEIYNVDSGGFFMHAGTLDIKEGEALPTLNPTHIYGYTIDIAEKDSSGNYPITITRSVELPLASQGGGRYKHTVTLKTSTGAILWTQTLSNSKNTPVNSYANLKTLFGGELLAGYGEYAQLDLHGGTEATDKLIKLDGTETTFASLGTIVYSDDCFLPK